MHCSIFDTNKKSVISTAKFDILPNKGDFIFIKGYKLEVKNVEHHLSLMSHDCTINVIEVA